MMMTKERQRYINKMVELANDIVRDYTWEKWERLWSMSSDWNSTHEDEIAMYEHENEDGVVDGFYIEDDYWIIPE